MAPYSSRHGARVIWVVVHTAEGARTVDSLAAWFNREGSNASAHALADDNEINDAFVPYSLAAWTLRGGNTRSDNLELCGFADWTRDEWLQHMGMLRLAAGWIRTRCLERGIPIVKIGPADVAAGRPGVIGHVDYTEGTGDGTHWDPGPNFPWDLVMAMARGDEPREQEDEEMIIAAVVKGKKTYGVYSGGVLTGLWAGDSPDNAAARNPLWVTEAEWNELDRKSRQLVGDIAAAAK
jgi:hypothetical protein